MCEVAMVQIELDDRWLGGGGDFRVRERQKAMVWSSFDLELDIKMIVGEISGRETWKLQLIDVQELVSKQFGTVHQKTKCPGHGDNITVCQNQKHTL